jgi:hypothetical protein
LLAHGRWFSPGTPASSTTKTGRHDIAAILLKVVLNTKIFLKNYLFEALRIGRILTDWFVNIMKGQFKQ